MIATTALSPFELPYTTLEHSSGIKNNVQHSSIICQYHKKVPQFGVRLIAAGNVLNDINLDRLNSKFNEEDEAIFFVTSKIILSKHQDDFRLPVMQTIERLGLSILSFHIDIDLHVMHCKSQLDEDGIRASDYLILDLKQALLTMKLDDCHRIMKNYHRVNWNWQSKYCGTCGRLLESDLLSTEKKCIHCGLSFFPRFSPAVMVLIYEEDRILLSRSPHFPPGEYSVTAGFIDVGETAEQAAHREVKEELGIEIGDLEYFSTQAWPFPDSFMIAFRAPYASGQLIVSRDEIEDARWFNLSNLPQLSPSISIARQLINSHLTLAGE